MQKRIFGIVFVLIFILAGQLVLAQEDNLSVSEKVDMAYQCLNDKVEGNCESLSLQEQTFSVLATGECRSELSSASDDGKCWPNGNCRIKETAQAILAMSNTGSSTASAEDWLLSQKAIPRDVEWILQVDTAEASSCKITYSGSSYQINLNEDKKISEDNAGPCLSKTGAGYWLQMSSSEICQNHEYQISCDKDFLSNLLFRESGSSTIHVTEQSNSASAGGTTTEKVESSCFGSGSCDYEGSLWASLALSFQDREINSFLPYLIVKSDDNQRFLPESFLYYLTGSEDYRSSVLLKQSSNQYWITSGDRYYDTAVALYPFQTENPPEKQNSKDWLLSSQDREGCWQGNIRNTAFLLASVWPQGSSGNGGNLDCESEGFYCMSSASCSGEILDQYSCPSLFKCCSEPRETELCSDLNGDICSPNQVCREGEITITEDLSRGEVCCVGGSCETALPPEESECKIQGGACRFTCESGEKETTYSCDISGAICCVEDFSNQGDSKGFTWIWILLILITLVVVGIIFRDKLRMWWLKAKSSFGKGGKGQSSGPPGRPGPGSGRPSHGFSRFPSKKPSMNAPERRILLPSESGPSQGPRPRHRQSKPSRPQKELDDVLKKLKEMSE